MNIISHKCDLNEKRAKLRVSIDFQGIS